MKKEMKRCQLFAEFLPPKQLGNTVEEERREVEVTRNEGDIPYKYQTTIDYG